MKSALRPRHVALLVLVSGLVLTVSAWYFAGGLVNAEGQTRTADRARLAAELLQRRMQRYIDVLYGVEAFAYRDPAPSHAEFRRFVAALDIPHRFPGLQGVGLVRRVKDTERDAYIKRTREDRSLSPQGFPAFDIRPGGQRDEYWVLDFFEPFEGHEGLFGTDVRTRADEAAAAARALQSGGPAATGRYRLSEGPDSPYGMIIYLAAAKSPAPASATNRAAPASAPAFVDAVLSVDAMLGDTFSEPLLAGTQVRIVDRGEMGTTQVAGSQESVFYRTSEAQEPPTFLSWLGWRYRHSHELPVAGRLWSVDFQSAPETHPWITRFPLLVLASGLAITMATYLAVAGIPGARRRASAQAASTADELRRQLSFTQQLIEAIPNPVFFKDAGGRYLGCNRAFEESMGVARANLIGKTAHDVTAPDDADFSVRADTALFERTGSQVYETELDYASDGERHDVLISKATFYAPSGEVAGLVGVLLDITERKRLEADTLDSHERLRAVIRAAPLAIIARDLDVVIRMWNPAAERMFGWNEAEALETKILVVPDRLRAETRALRLRAEAGETISIEETRRVRRDGTEIDVSVSMAPIYGGEGVVTGTMIAIVDISQRKAAERALRESEEQLRLAMEAAQMGMWYWEVASDRFLHSEGLSVLFGGKSTDRHGDYRLFRERLHPDDYDLVDATLRHAVKKGTDFQVDYRVIWPDGSVHWLANRAQVHRDASGRAERIVGMAMEITDRKLAEQRIAHMAHHDALTGLPNRVLLRDRIQQAIAQAHRGGTQLAVLFLDLDRFKNINDSLGHQLGDRLLQSVASRILVCVREGDTVARVGGDEFVIVIPGLGSSPNAASVASKILEVLASPFHLGGNDLHVGASLGISLYPADGSDAETLMRNADTAMYHAKDSGRGNYQFFTQSMNVTAQQRLTVETALRRALEAEEFELYYQPIYDLRDRSITGFEALLRWNAPGGELVQPARFITAAEESGLIVPIGDWVLREALMHAKTWQSAGRPLMVSVNVSAYQLARPAFVEQLRTMLEEISIDPELVELEVTEGVIIEGAGDARDAIDHVAALGVGIAIDDFGTGYSGLAYLKRLPIDTVKIDQSFVRDLTVDPDDAAIVTAIVAMAKSLGVDVVAEGVETEEQLAELRRLGCHRAQGFLFAHPMSAGDVWTLLKAEGPSPP